MGGISKKSGEAAESEIRKVLTKQVVLELS